jgi:hypothetical protein
MEHDKRALVQVTVQREVTLRYLKSRVFGIFPCIGRSRGEIASIPVPGNAPWFGGKPPVRNYSGK